MHIYRCMCVNGPNGTIYGTRIWFSEVSLSELLSCLPRYSIRHFQIQDEPSIRKLGCKWLGTMGWLFHVLIRIYWGYNPLILTFDPNFLGHPSMLLLVDEIQGNPPEIWWLKVGSNLPPGYPGCGFLEKPPGPRMTHPMLNGSGIPILKNFI